LKGGVGNFGKIGIGGGYFTSDSATQLEASNRLPTFVKIEKIENLL